MMHNRFVSKINSENHDATFQPCLAQTVLSKTIRLVELRQNNDLNDDDQVTDEAGDDDDDDVDNILNEIKINSLIADDDMRMNAVVASHNAQYVTNAATETLTALNWKQTSNSGDVMDVTLAALATATCDDHIDSKLLRQAVDCYVDRLRSVKQSSFIHLAEIIHPNAKMLPFKSILVKSDLDNRLSEIIHLMFKTIFGLLILFQNLQINQINDDNNNENNSEINENDVIVGNGIFNDANDDCNEFQNQFAPFEIQQNNENNDNQQQSQRLSDVLKARRHCFESLDSIKM